MARGLQRGINKNIEGLPQPGKLIMEVVSKSFFKTRIQIDLFLARLVFSSIIFSALVFFPASATANIRDLNEIGIKPSQENAFSQDRSLSSASDLTISSSQASFSANGGTGSVALSATSSWSLQSDVDWIANFSVATGTGSATIHYSVAVNPASSPRTESIKFLDKKSVVRQTLIVTQSGAKSNYAFTLDSAKISAQGGGSIAELIAPDNSAWTLKSTASWITNISPMSGTGSATIAYSVLPNADCDPRSNAIVVLNEDSVAQLWITQNAGGGHYQVSASQLNVPAQGGSNNVFLTAGSSCSWQVQTDANWITDISPTNGNGSESIAFLVRSNSGCSPRSAVVRILDSNSAVRESVTISQAGAPASYALGSTYLIFTSSGGNVSVGLTANCSWTAVSDVPWISNVSPANGNSNATIYFTVVANTNCPSRIGTIKIYDGNSVHRQTLSVTQSGNPTTYALSPAGATFTSGGGSTNVNVAASNEGCIWTISNSNNWIQVTPVSAIGSANVTVTVSPNSSTNSRSGTILIAGVPFPVTQAATVVCTYSVAPAVRNHAATGENGSVSVGASSPDCIWTASSGASWITITSGAQYAGNGIVTYSVAPNPNTTSRSTTITVAGKTFTMAQAGMSGSVQISSTNAHFAATGGNGSFDLTAPTGLQWQATTDAPGWITLNSMQTGTNGTVMYSVSANETMTSRQGTIFVGDKQHVVTQEAGAGFAAAKNNGAESNFEQAQIAQAGRSIAYLADETLGLAVVDFGDPKNPVLLGSSDLAFNGLDVAVYGTIACVVGTREVYSKSETPITLSIFYVIDLSNTINPKVIGKIEGNETNFLEVAIFDNGAYVKDGFGQLKVIDISDPEVLRFIQ